MHRDAGEGFGDGVGGVGGEAQFEERHGGDLEASGAGAAVHEHRDAGGGAARLFHDFEALEDTAAAGDDVLDDEDALAGREGEAAAHHEYIVFLFGEDVADLGLACDFLADHETAHRGREDRVELESEAAHLGDKQLGEAFHGVHALAHLGALEVVAAVQAGAEHEMTLEQSPGVLENAENLLLRRVHASTLRSRARKNKNNFATAASSGSLTDVADQITVSVPLEDEVGDVLEKALRCAGLTEDELARRTGVPSPRIKDAIDYRSELTTAELRRLALELGLNEVGFCALGAGRYPLPEADGLPFCVWPLRMPHGIGVVNAYLVGECGGTRAVLFDAGAGIEALLAAWPRAVKQLDAVFLTHVEAEHAGGLCEIVARFGGVPAFVPAGVNAPCGMAVGEGERKYFGPFEIETFSTPGHSPAHNCYAVRAHALGGSRSLLIAGDLVFAGSAGGAYYCAERLRLHMRRVLEAVPPDTVIAPGHGPMTTAGNELRFNPFVT